MSNNESRLVRLTRRTLLLRGAALGAVTVVPAMGCGNDDSASLSTNSQPAGAAKTSGASGASTGSGPAAGELAVSFTFLANGGRVRNPYVAVWIESTGGQLVAPVSAWFQQDQKGARYLNELRRWFAAGGRQASGSVSEATRAPGSYTVVWNGTGSDGATVAAGEYVLCIEAAREHGPYDLITAPVTVGGESFQRDLQPNGELTAASVRYAA